MVVPGWRGAVSAEIPGLHVLVSERELAAPSAIDLIRAMVAHDPPVAVHLRARIPAVELFDLARDLAARAWVSGGWCVVNGRPDVALAASAQAVQLGRTALAVEDVVRVLPPHSGVRVGASVHGETEAHEAVHQGADYIVAGTVFPTRSHPGRPGCGPAGIRSAVKVVGKDVPVLAIGGVDASRVASLVEAGARGIVVSRAVWTADDPLVAVSTLSRAIAATRAPNEQVSDVEGRR